MGNHVQFSVMCPWCSTADQAGYACYCAREGCEKDDCPAKDPMHNWSVPMVPRFR